MKDLIDSMDFKIETKYLEERHIKQIAKSAEAKGLVVEKETFENEVKVVIKLREFNTKQLKDFNRVFAELENKGLVSRF